MTTSKLNILPDSPEETKKGRFPSWLHRKIPRGNSSFKTDKIMEKLGLNTVCEEAKCPNRMECYSKKTATFLALGKACTRACPFCDIDFSKNPKMPEADEPLRIALAVKELGLEHVVITMVARDDLADKGALALAKIMQEVRKVNPKVTLEVLTSDFSGDLNALNIVLDEKPEIFNHNIETTRALTPKVRHKATYETTLNILKEAKKSFKARFIKSGIMVGLGEEGEEVKRTIHDLYLAGCDIITIGQYLQAGKQNLRVKAFITPEQFQEYAQYGYGLGVAHMYSAPFVRSSYNAKEVLQMASNRK